MFSVGYEETKSLMRHLLPSYAHLKLAMSNVVERVNESEVDSRFETLKRMCDV